MNIWYSDEIMTRFYSPQYVHQEGDEINIMGHAGDTTIGEYVHLYFQVQRINSNYADSKIIRAKFSAIGGVVLIAAADKFCSLVEGSSFQDALKYCGPEYILLAPQEKIYSINFVIQAFYKALETLTFL